MKSRFRNAVDFAALSLNDLVHSTHETKMLDRFVNELVKGVNAGLKGQSIGKPFVGGAAAADHTVAVMASTLKTLPPQDIIDAFNANASRERLPGMWKALEQRTVDCIVHGVIGLAEYWESAWVEGRSDPNAKPLPANMPEIADTDLMKLYRDKTFMASHLLSQMKLP